MPYHEKTTIWMPNHEIKHLDIKHMFYSITRTSGWKLNWLELSDGNLFIMTGQRWTIKFRKSYMYSRVTVLFLEYWKKHFSAEKYTLGNYIEAEMFYIYGTCRLQTV